VKKRDMPVVYVRLPECEKNALTVEAERIGESMSDTVRRAIKLYIQERERESVRKELLDDQG